jgi:uncharacterized protein YwqG
MPVDILASISESGLTRVAEGLQRILKPSIHLVGRDADESEPEVGTSRIGGSPDLPRGWHWPQWSPGWKVETLAFVAQVRLSDIAAYDVERALPPGGMLYFFYAAAEQPWGTSPGDRGGGRVLYYDGDATALRQRAAPETLPEGKVFTPFVLTCAQEVSLPPSDWLAVEQLGLRGAEGEQYDELLNRLGEMHEQNGTTAHRLLGYPDQLQDNIQLQCQLAPEGLYERNERNEQDPRRPELRQGAGAWRLLLQVDSDGEAGLEWGDYGRLYFLIRGESLAARDFSDVWVVLQSM